MVQTTWPPFLTFHHVVQHLMAFRVIGEVIGHPGKEAGFGKRHVSQVISFPRSVLLWPSAGFQYLRSSNAYQWSWGTLWLQYCINHVTQDVESGDASSCFTANDWEFIFSLYLRSNMIPVEYLGSWISTSQFRYFP